MTGETDKKWMSVITTRLERVESTIEQLLTILSRIGYHLGEEAEKLMDGEH